MAIDPVRPAPQQRLAFGVEPSDRRYRLRLARYPALAQSLAEFVGARTGIVRLLDVGVGRGRTRRYLVPLGVAERVEFVGIDVDPQIAARCHERAAWRLARADVARPLPLRSATFDALVCEQVIEHVTDPASALAEFARVLRPGGLLVVGVPTFPPGVAWLRQRIVRRSDGTGEHGHVQTFTKGALVRLVRATGAFDVRCARGFRSASGGLLSPLEGLRWWWRLNCAFGRAFPSLCAEVQVVAVRNPAAVCGFPTT